MEFYPAQCFLSEGNCSWVIQWQPFVQPLQFLNQCPVLQHTLSPARVLEFPALSSLGLSSSFMNAASLSLPNLSTPIMIFTPCRGLPIAFWKDREAGTIGWGKANMYCLSSHKFYFLLSITSLWKKGLQILNAHTDNSRLKITHKMFNRCKSIYFNMLQKF